MKVLRAAESIAGAGAGWGISDPSAGSEGGTAELDDSGRVCPSCHKLMTVCYKKGARAGIQSDIHIQEVLSN